MSAVAELWIEVPDELDERPTEPVRPPARPARLPLLAGQGEGAGDDVPAWNVLAEELVAYPPAHRRIFLDPDGFEAERRSAEDAGRNADRSYGEAWLEGERRRLRDRAAAGLSAQRDVPSLTAPAVRRARPTAPRTPRSTGQQELAPQLAPPLPLARPAHGARSAAHRRLPTAGAAAVEPRGLRRLLPGVATLAALVGLWFGVGALASVHRPGLAVVPGSVKVAGGYEYVARPGDTLWSIAAALRPGGDPRPMVARLEAEIGGGQLVPGDRLLFP